MGAVLAVGATSTAAPASAYDANCATNYPQCCVQSCDDFCCYSNLQQYCSNNTCPLPQCVDTCQYCDPKCMGSFDSGTKDASTDTGAIDAPVSDAPFDDALPPLGPDNTCYVFVHGSFPADWGPEARPRPDADYWGTGRDPGAAGRFIMAMLTASEAGDVPLAQSRANGQRWATVNWDGTWEYWWAAVDVLHQLDQIERGEVPVSLAYDTGEACPTGKCDETYWFERSPGFDPAWHHVGVNFCQPGDYLVTVGHSMGNLVVGFLLENAHKNALNYEFLRTGGESEAMPFFPVYSGSDPKYVGWRRHIVSPDDGTKDQTGWTCGSYDNRGCAPTLGTVDSRPKWQTGGAVHDPADETFYAGVGPDARCNYPPATFNPNGNGMLNYENYFPYLDPTKLGQTSGSKLDLAARAGVCHGEPDPGSPLPASTPGQQPGRSVEEILSRIAYHYSIAGVLQGSPLADCGCFNEKMLFDVPKLQESYCATMTTINNTVAHKAPCNPAAWSMQTEVPFRLKYMGGQPSRIVYLLTGTNPYFPLGYGAYLRPVDFITGDEQTPYPPPINDSGVPISSTMACDIDPWARGAWMAVGDDSPGFGFVRGLCSNAEKIWPLAVDPQTGKPVAIGRNDTVMALTHMEEVYGVARRTAYATPDSWWTHVRNPIDPWDSYEPGDAIVFGKVMPRLPVSLPCFFKPLTNTCDGRMCNLGFGEFPSPYDPSRTITPEGKPNDPRGAFFGCEPYCIDTGTGTVLRQHRSMAHVLGIEELYAQRRNRQW